MLKPTAVYKMSKAAKTYKAFNWHRKGINAIMQATIQAELAEKIQPRSRREQKDTND